MAHIRRGVNGNEIHAYSEATLAAPLFGGTLTSTALTALGESLTSVVGSLAHRYIPVHVSLPDAAVRLTVFELDEMSNSHNDQSKFARWRLQQEFGTDAIACASQNLGNDGERHLLLGMAIRGDWQATILQALEQAGVVPWSLSADICRQFNRIHGKYISDSGALVNMSQDSWGLLLWDPAGRVRFSRSRWRNGADNMGTIAAEIERSIIAYAHGSANRSILNVYVNAASTTIDDISAALDSRLSHPCIQIHPGEGLIAENNFGLCSSLQLTAFAAALDK
jgi:hypothetical protein